MTLFPTDTRSDELKEDPIKGSARLNITFAKTLLDKLENIQKKTHASTLSEVFRNALTVYGALLSYHLDGYEIVVRSPEGKEKVMTLFL